MPPASLSSWNRAASIGSLLTTASRCRRCRDGSRGLGAAFYDWIDSGDIDQVVELLADDFVEHEEMPGLAPGREGVGQLFTMAGKPKMCSRPVTRSRLGYGSVGASLTNTGACST